MASRRSLYELPGRRFRRQGRAAFLGENNTDSLTDEIYSLGYFRRCRNYHLFRGGILSRQGIQKYREAEAQVADAKITGLGRREFGASRQLVAGCGDGLYERQSDGTWDAIHGAHSLTADTRFRFQPYHASNIGWLIGTNGVDVPFKWDGENDIQALGAGAPSDQAEEDRPPARARSIAEFEGRLFACNTPAAPTITSYSDDTSENNWPAGNHFHCTRASEAMALARFDDGILLVFHRRSVHRIQFHPVDTGFVNAYFYHEPVDSERGTVSTDSVLVHRGRCYFADTDGIYEIAQANRPARLISRPIEVMWEGLKPETLSKIQAFPISRRGEICFLVTGVSEPDLFGPNFVVAEDHNLAFIYNPEVARIWGPEAGWTIFEVNNNALEFTCGLKWESDTNEVVNLLGGGDGYVYEAWGDTLYGTGNTDAGVDIETRLRTGYVDFGMPNHEKGLRSFVMDILLPYGERNFFMEIHGEEDRAAFFADQVISESAGGRTQIDVSLQLDVSRFPGATPREARFAVGGSARYFETLIRYTGDQDPHAILRLNWWFMRERQLD